MTITALPAAPSKLSDTPEQFTMKADAWVAALATFTTQANSLETNVNAKEVLATAAAAAAAVSETNAAASAASALAAPGTNATSVTSRTMAIGTRTFAIQSGKSFVAGMKVIIAYASAVATQFMYATVTSYSSTTLVVTVESYVGSGTYADWVISITGPSMPVLGEDQTYQIVTSSRVIGTTYTNNTGRPIFVSIVLETTGAACTGIAMVSSIVVGKVYLPSVSEQHTLSFIVPTGATYKVVSASGLNVHYWVELC